MNRLVPPPSVAQQGRLESWKEIAAYLGKGVRTVVRWEKSEELPVHRHLHERRSSVFAFKSEIDSWWQTRRATLQDEVEPPTPPARSKKWLWLAALVPLAGVSALLLHPSPSSLPPLPWKFEVLTSYPGSQQQASFSPDGSHFAFAWNGGDRPDTDIYVQAVGSAEPIRLTRHPYVDMSPAWSPDGKWIAFLRRSPELTLELLMLPAFGGAERKLADLGERLYMDALQLSWSPDGKWLAFPDRGPNGYGIRALAPETGERRQLTMARFSRNDLDPAFSPDGRSLAFRRGNDTLAEIMVLPLSPDLSPRGEPRAVTHLDSRTFGPAWSADGRHIFFMSGTWLSHTNLYRVQVVPAVTQPEAVTTASWESHSSVSVSWRKGLLAYCRKVADVNIWMLEKQGQIWKAPKQVRNLSSTLTEKDPDFSPDGRQVAFMSDRSGSPELWISRLDGYQARKLTSFGGGLIDNPRWSPDGRQIAFCAIWQRSSTIWLVDTAGGQPRKFLDNAWSPSWSADGRFLYHVRTEPNQPSRGKQDPQPVWRVYRIPAGGGESRPAVAATPSFAPVESADGRYLFYRDGKGLWRLPLAGGNPTFLTPIRWTTPYVVSIDGVFFLAEQDRRMQDRALLFLPFHVGAPVQVARVPTFQGFGLAVSRDGKTLLYSQLDQELTSLMYTRGLW